VYGPGKPASHGQPAGKQYSESCSASYGGSPSKCSNAYILGNTSLTAAAAAAGCEPVPHHRDELV